MHNRHRLLHHSHYSCICISIFKILCTVSCTRYISSTPVPVSSGLIQYLLQGVQEILCFFHNSLQPLPRLQSSQRNAIVQSLLLAGSFLYNQKQPSANGGEVTNFREFLEKKHPQSSCGQTCGGPLTQKNH